MGFISIEATSAFFGDDGIESMKEDPRVACIVFLMLTIVIFIHGGVNYHMEQCLLIMCQLVYLDK